MTSCSRSSLLHSIPQICFASSTWGGARAKTVREYDQVLCATLLGQMVEPYSKRQERQLIIKAAKLSLFDVGVAGSITRRTIAEECGEPFGKAFEHDIRFWRTKSGQDVDFILGPGEVAIEVKGRRAS